MLFASSFFLTIFLPIVLLLYWIAPSSYRNSLLLVISLAFYAWGEPIFVFVLFGLTLVNFGLVRYMDQSQHRKKWLVFYLILNIGFLVLFKYTTFILTNLGWVFGENFTHKGENIFPLPLGISFYAFHAITYGVDVYRKTFTAQNRIADFSLYLFLFPHQIAGPIVTYGSIEAEIRSRSFDLNGFTKGMYRFVIGLAKKVIISNGLILVLDACNEQQAINDTSTLAWIEMLAYTLHIYFDFSGYSDMAIGLGQVFGFHFPENFDKPYSSKSITEFWQRWHKSLGYFMKHYLYIPLGGNRTSSFKVYRNLFIVFFLSGLWHGASWNFVIWGMFHGFWLIIERLFLGKLLKKIGLFALVWTFIIVLNGWVFFHETSFSDSLNTFQKLWGFDFTEVPKIRDITYYSGIILLACSLVVLECIPVLGKLKLKWINGESSILQISRFGWMLVLYLIAYSYIVAGSYNPFIYFNF